MYERFTKLYASEPNLYREGSPVIIRAGELLCDNATGKLLVHLKMHSISETPITFVKVEITPLDSASRAIGTNVVHEYLDLEIYCFEIFGAQVPIRILENRTRAFTVTITEIGFDDGSLWECSADCTCDKAAFSPIPKQKSIEEIITDPYARLAYRIKFGDTAMLEARDHGDFWLCTCGQVNHRDDKTCINCAALLTDLLEINFDMLRTEGIYCSALELSSRKSIKSLEAAVREFEKIPDYKDSAERITSVKETIEKLSALEQKNKKRCKKALLASLLIVLSIALVGAFIALFNYGNVQTETDSSASSGLTYFSNGDGTCYVCGPGSCTDTKVVIPTTAPNGERVVGISIRAFYGTDINSVIIPDSIKYIRRHAFSNCYQLTTIEYRGQKASWDSIVKDEGWNANSYFTVNTSEE